MKQLIICIFFIICHFTLNGQIQGDNEFIAEINSIFAVQSRENAKIVIDEFCSIDDYEMNNQRYQYSIKDVIIEEPRRDGKTTGFRINIYCKDNYDCIYLNNRKFISDKDFEILTREGAEAIYRNLMRLQDNCR